jgi:hypothetical protein
MVMHALPSKNHLEPRCALRPEFQAVFWSSSWQEGAGELLLLLTAAREAKARGLSPQQHMGSARPPGVGAAAHSHVHTRPIRARTCARPSLSHTCTRRRALRAYLRAYGYFGSAEFAPSSSSRLAIAARVQWVRDTYFLCTRGKARLSAFGAQVCRELGRSLLIK